jgi:2-haloacid dehalogenase
MAGVSVGFRTFWVNRAKMPDEYLDFSPLRVLSDLRALADID